MVRSLIASCICLVLALPAMANPLEGHLLKSRTLQDEGREFRVDELVNPRGEYEVHVILLEKRWLVPDTQRTLLIGRAIDEPQRRVTTWFVPASLEILSPIEYTQIGDDPWPTARSLIQNRFGAEKRFYAWVAFETLAPQLSLAIAQADDFFEQIKKEQLELFDLEVRTRHLELTNPQDPFLPIARSLLAQGWASLAERVHEEKTQKVWKYAAGDVALKWVTMKAFQIAGNFLGTAAQKISETEALSVVKERLVKLSGTARTKAAKAASIAGSGLRLAAVKMTLQQQISSAVSYLEARSALSRVAVKSALAVFKTAKAGVREFKYIGQTQAIQIAMETLARPEDLFDPNPLIMAKKMSSDEDFVQNVAYMANETFWMAGVSSMLQDNLKKRLAICGAIGLVDSLSMSILVKGEADPTRIALDTGWEALLGNLQTQLDVGALRYFENMAARQRNPKLRFVGYAVAIVDQAAGYFGYAKVTHLLEEGKKSGEEKTPEKTSEPAPQNFQAPQLKLIPILSPA